MNNSDSRNMKIQDMTHIALAAALIAIMAQISIPMPAGVPMTLQTLAVPVVGIILGDKKGALSCLIYLFIGAAGLPVFSGFKGGIGVVLGVTGGFIISFPLMAWLAGYGQKKGGYGWIYTGIILGTLVNYLVGMAWFVVTAGSTWIAAFTACVLPFIPTTIIKIILAGILGKKIREALLRAHVLN